MEDNKERYSTNPRTLGKLGFAWKHPAPPLKILFSDLKKNLYKIEVDFNHLPGLLTEEKDADWSSVSMTYWYTAEGTMEKKDATEEIYGPQDKVYNHIVGYYSFAADMFIKTWNTAKHRKLRSLTNIKSPFIPASTAQKLSEEFYKSRTDPKAFAKKLDKDKSNVFKELKGDRKISIDQAIQYSKEFGCDPVSLLFEDVTTDLWGEVDLYNDVTLDDRFIAGQVRPLHDYYYGKKKTQHPIIKVPRDIYSPDIKAIKIKTEGSHLNNLIAYYHYSTSANKSAHGKLSVIGQEMINDDLGIHETHYYLGIYEEKLGGGGNIINPDPLAKNKYIYKDIKHNVKFVTPVVALVNFYSLFENNKRREALRYTDEVFKAQKEIKKLQKQADEIRVKAEEWSKKRMQTEVNQLMDKINKEEKLYQGNNWFNKLSNKKIA
tara:strand:- start:429 stop:1727 length:1299 start_codon:yes stop_codon:yes gene_type:complete